MDNFHIATIIIAEAGFLRKELRENKKLSEVQKRSYDMRLDSIIESAKDIRLRGQVQKEIK